MKINDLINLLQADLQSQASLETKLWFDNYLKGLIEYRGLKTPLVIKILKNWVNTYNIRRFSLKKQLKICEKLISQGYAEDKFAGIIYIQMNLINSDINPHYILDTLNVCFEKNYFSDWSTTDWCCVRILDPMCLIHGKTVVDVVSRWYMSEHIWQRRASLVALRGISQDKSYHPKIRKMVQKLVKEQERFIQTAIGWLLSDMSKYYHDEVEQLFKKHIKLISMEVVKRHAKYLNSYEQLIILKKEAMGKG